MKYFNDLDPLKIESATVIPMKLENANEYVVDIDSIRYATTGIVDAMGANLFFEEATQMLINAIKSFQDGYFDCAFYSLRESIELSIGTIYLTSQKDKIDDWKNQGKGFETGRMTKFLKDHETVFQEVRDKLSDFFEKIRDVEGEINKYAHKQRYTLSTVNPSFLFVKAKPY